MGWAIVSMLSAVAILLLYASGRCPRAALEIGAVAVLIALAGYSWQGSPEMDGHPVVSLPNR